MKNIFVSIFSVSWLLIILLEYGNKHFLHHLAFENFRFPGLAISVVLIIGLITIASSTLNTKIALGKHWNGLSMLVAFLVFLLLVIYPNFEYGGLKASSSYLFIAFLKCVGVLLSVAFIWLSGLFAGHWINKKLGFQLHKYHSSFLDLCTGILVQCCLLLLIAAIGLLKSFVILPLLLIPFIINYKYLGPFFKKLLLNPVYTKGKDSPFLVCLFMLFAFFLSINFITNMAPFPSGFDSRNYYINISRLLGLNGSLIEGYQPYPWSLFIAQGFAAFKSSYIALMLSFSSIVICMYGLFEWSRNYLNLSKLHAMMIIVAFSFMPAVGNHMFIELKVDFGLLIFQMATVLLFYDIVSKYRDKGGQAVNFKDLLPLIIALGIYSGFATSIKVINLYLIFSLVIISWAMYFRFLGFLSLFMILMGLTIIGDFDSISGLSEYHLSMDILKYILFFGGLALFVLLMIKQPKRGIMMVKTTALYGVVIFFMMAPWLGKNYIETKSLSPNKILLGKATGPSVSMKKLVNTYNQSKKNTK